MGRGKGKMVLGARGRMHESIKPGRSTRLLIARTTSSREWRERREDRGIAWKSDRSWTGRLDAGLAGQRGGKRLGVACRTPGRQRVWQRERTGAATSPGTWPACVRAHTYTCRRACWRVMRPRCAAERTATTTTMQPNISATRSRCRKISRMIIRPVISRRFSRAPRSLESIARNEPDVQNPPREISHPGWRSRDLRLRPPIGGSGGIFLRELRDRVFCKRRFGLAAGFRFDLKRNSNSSSSFISLDSVSCARGIAEGCACAHARSPRLAVLASLGVR